MNIKVRLCVTLCTLFLTPGMLLAQSRTHDGFFLRLQAGFGNGSFTAKYDGGNNEYTASSARIFAYKIGWSQNRNWALHYNFTGLSATDLVKLGGSSSGYSVYSRAIGASYYFLSQNIYLAPEFRLSSAAELNVGNVRYLYSGSGLGLSLGKEWWTSSNWGLGLALSYHQDSLKGDNHDGTASTSHLGILFSATYN